MLDAIATCWTSRERRLQVSPCTNRKEECRKRSRSGSIVLPETSEDHYCDDHHCDGHHCDEHHCDDDNSETLICTFPVSVAATTTMERTVEPGCWICLSSEVKEIPTEDGSGMAMEMPEQLCKCPRKAHPSCLKQWQLVKMGTPEETHYKFCSAELAMLTGTGPTPLQMASGHF
jgi:hypothetical protein